MQLSQPLTPGLIDPIALVPRRIKDVLKPSTSLTSEVSTRVSRTSSVEVGFIGSEEAIRGGTFPIAKAGHPWPIDETREPRKDFRGSSRHMKNEYDLWRAMKAEFLQPFHPMKCAQVSSGSRTTQADSLTRSELTSRQWTPPSLRDSSLVDTEDEAEASDVEIILGPTQLAAYASSLQDLFLPDGLGSDSAPIKSHGQCLALSDALRLAKARSFNAPLSFGSVAHLVTRQPLQCRPCMFEQRPGRCRKSYLCDFCHLSHRRRVKVTKATLTSGIWRV